jgi:hypothetical protein
VWQSAWKYCRALLCLKGCGSIAETTELRRALRERASGVAFGRFGAGEGLPDSGETEAFAECLHDNDVVEFGDKGDGA